MGTKDIRTKEERRAYRASYYIKNKEKLQAMSKSNHYKRRYGITLEEYNEMVAQQNNVCAICFKNESVRNLHVDHSHTTGEIRGLLCSSCNMALGLFKDDIVTMEAAIKYLKNYG